MERTPASASPGTKLERQGNCQVRGRCRPYLGIRGVGGNDPQNFQVGAQVKLAIAVSSMSYLFEEPIAISVTFSAGDVDVVAIIPPALWNTLFDTAESQSQQAAVIVTLQFPQNQSFSCWCRMDEKVCQDSRRLRR